MASDGLRWQHAAVPSEHPLNSEPHPLTPLTSQAPPPQWLLRTATIQFYLGPAASGAQPHWHGAAWNWLVHGRKRWWFWPPSEAIYAQSHVRHSVGGSGLGRGRSAHGRNAHGRNADGRNADGRNANGGDGGGDGGHADGSSAERPPRSPLGRPLVCEQRAGEVVLVPELWGHATLNLQPSIGWASELYFDRAYAPTERTRRHARNAPAERTDCR